MFIIRNHLIPFPGYKAITIWPFLFTRADLTAADLIHEAIHARQQKEMLVLPFFLWYLLEYVVRLFTCRFDTRRAYRSISFEQEAYSNEKDYAYLNTRRPYAFIGFIR